MRGRKRTIGVSGSTFISLSEDGSNDHFILFKLGGQILIPLPIEKGR
jgi:hypothetical protein